MAVNAKQRGVSKTAARKRKGDFIIAPGASKVQIQCDMAVVQFDRTAHEMDAKWGIDRLVDLVSPEMAMRYGQALSRMNDAISDASDPELAERRADGCVKGCTQAMDQHATENGAQAASDLYWEVIVDDLKLGICADIAAWPTIQDQRPDLTLVSLREVALAYKHYSATALDFMAQTKQHFEGAKVIDIRSKTLDDPIPF